MISAQLCRKRQQSFKEFFVLFYVIQENVQAAFQIAGLMQAIPGDLLW